MKVLDRVGPARRSLWLTAIKVAFDPSQHPRGGHEENSGEFSTTPGQRRHLSPVPSDEPRRDRRGGPGGGPQPAATGPRTRPEDIARGDVYGKPMPHGKYETGDPRNDPEFEDRHDRIAAQVDRYVGADLPSILGEMQHARESGKPMDEKRRKMLLHLYKVHQDDMAKGIGGATDELFDKLEPRDAQGQPIKRRDGSGRLIRDAYTPERTALHNQIIDKLIADAEARGVPKEHRAIVMGGPSGAGKSTLLKNQAEALGIKGDPSHPDNYVVLNPDDFKEPLLDNIDMSRYPGLSRNELASIVHEESSHLNKMAVKEMMRRGYNVIHDVTLANEEKGYKHYVAPYPGYDVTHVMVDGPIENSRHNAGLRYKFAKPETDATRNFGGRFMDMDVVNSQAPTMPGYRSKNAQETEKFVHRPEVGNAVIYDPVAGQAQWVKRGGQMLMPGWTLNHGYTTQMQQAASIPYRVSSEWTKEGIGMPTGESPIKAQIRAFREGRLDRESLIRFLTEYDYADPAKVLRHSALPKERHYEIEGGREDVPGTFDEVHDAHNQGELPRDVFMEVIRRLHAA